MRHVGHYALVQRDGRDRQSVRPPRIVGVIGVGVLALAVCVAAVVGLVRWKNDPGIRRTRGRVISAAVSSGYTTICMSNTTDAGSTYGSKVPRDEFCIKGRASGEAPAVGACVVVQARTESDRVQVERSQGC